MKNLQCKYKCTYLCVLAVGNSADIIIIVVQKHIRRTMYGLVVSQIGPYPQAKRVVTAPFCCKVLQILRKTLQQFDNVQILRIFSRIIIIITGGWWFRNCFQVHLNGEYFADGVADESSAGIQWRGTYTIGKYNVYVATVMRITRNQQILILQANRVKSCF